MEMRILHVYAPKGEYIGQVRRRGHRLWETVGKPSKTAEAAMIKALKGMTPEHKRARVLLCTEWHDPHVLMELTR
jgi:hypothetical protein